MVVHAVNQEADRQISGSLKIFWSTKFQDRLKKKRRKKKKLRKVTPILRCVRVGKVCTELRHFLENGSPSQCCQT